MPMKRGRPRPQSTINRDAELLSLLLDGKARSRQDIAVALNVTGNTAYLALRRLRALGQVETRRVGSRHLWIAHTHG